jgi:hypothetical protein
MSCLSTILQAAIHNLLSRQFVKFFQKSVTFKAFYSLYICYKTKALRHENFKNSFDCIFFVQYSFRSGSGGKKKFDEPWTPERILY